MAKAKKKVVLSLEEKIVQALIPVGEQPYAIPDNWCWVYASKVFDIEYGKGLPTKYLIDDGYPVFGANGQIGYYSEYMYEEAKALMSCRGAYSGTMNQSLPKSYVTSNSLIIEDKSKIMMPKYICYMYDALDTSKLISGSAQPQVTVQAFEKYPIPLPPLTEQQRIVEQIESLFIKLEVAKEKIKEIEERIEERKASILHKAFSGALTANWRKKNNIVLSSWTKKQLKECCSIGSGGTPSRKNPDYYRGSIPWIKTGEINWNYIYDSEEKINQEAIDNSSAKLYEAESVLVAMYGMGVTRGRASILKVQATTNQAVCVLQPNDFLNNRFLYYYFMCNYWNIRKCAIGGNQLNLSAAIIGKLDIDIPPIQEQIEIAKILDVLITKENQGSELIEKALEQIELIKKSILTKAFRGKLGTNNPDEKSAIELLKHIISEE